jgi:hypothetical protein
MSSSGMQERPSNTIPTKYQSNVHQCKSNKNSLQEYQIPDRRITKNAPEKQSPTDESEHEFTNSIVTTPELCSQAPQLVLLHRTLSPIPPTDTLVDEYHPYMSRIHPRRHVFALIKFPQSAGQLNAEGR